MEKSDRHTSLICAVFGLYIAIEGYRLGMGTFRLPGVGFMIFWAGLILLVLSIILFSGTFFSKTEEKKKLWEGTQWPNGIKLTAAVLVCALILRWMGFFLSIFFFLLFLLKTIEPQRWQIALLISVISVALCYLVFVVFLDLSFPEGILAGILG